MNTNDKQAFFAQYYGQKVWSDSFLDINEPNKDTLAYIRLKPLSSIINEDALEVARLNDTPHFKNQLLIGQALVHWLNKNGKSKDLNHEQIDFLRMMGYLIPFRSYSTEQLIELGWAKLIES